MKAFKAIRKLKEAISRVENSQLINLETEIRTMGRIVSCDDCGNRTERGCDIQCRFIGIATGFKPRSTNESN